MNDTPPMLEPDAPATTAATAVAAAANQPSAGVAAAATAAAAASGGQPQHSMYDLSTHAVDYVGSPRGALSPYNANGSPMADEVLTPHSHPHTAAATAAAGGGAADGAGSVGMARDLLSPEPTTPPAPFVGTEQYYGSTDADSAAATATATTAAAAIGPAAASASTVPLLVAPNQETVNYPANQSIAPLNHALSHYLAVRNQLTQSNESNQNNQNAQNQHNNQSFQHNQYYSNPTPAAAANTLNPYTLPANAYALHPSLSHPIPDMPYDPTTAAHGAGAAAAAAPNLYAPNYPLPGTVPNTMFGVPLLQSYAIPVSATATVAPTARPGMQYPPPATLIADSYGAAVDRKTMNATTATAAAPMSTATAATSSSAASGGVAAAAAAAVASGVRYLWVCVVLEGVPVQQRAPLYLLESARSGAGSLPEFAFALNAFAAPNPGLKVGEGELVIPVNARMLIAKPKDAAMAAAAAAAAAAAGGSSPNRNSEQWEQVGQFGRIARLKSEMGVWASEKKQPKKEPKKAYAFPQFFGRVSTPLGVFVEAAPGVPAGDFVYVSFRPDGKESFSKLNLEHLKFTRPCCLRFLFKSNSEAEHLQLRRFFQTNELVWSVKKLSGSDKNGHEMTRDRFINDKSKKPPLPEPKRAQIWLEDAAVNATESILMAPHTELESTREWPIDTAAAVAAAAAAVRATALQFKAEQMIARLAACVMPAPASSSSSAAAAAAVAVPPNAQEVLTLLQDVSAANQQMRAELKARTGPRPATEPMPSTPVKKRKANAPLTAPSALGSEMEVEQLKSQLQNLQLQFDQYTQLMANAAAAAAAAAAGAETERNRADAATARVQELELELKQQKEDTRLARDLIAQTQLEAERWRGIAAASGAAAAGAGGAYMHVNAVQFAPNSNSPLHPPATANTNTVTESFILQTQKPIHASGAAAAAASATATAAAVGFPVPTAAMAVEKAVAPRASPFTTSANAAATATH